jgi:hypothetical protein
MKRSAWIDRLLLVVAIGLAVGAALMWREDRIHSDPGGPAFEISQEGTIAVGPVPKGKHFVSVLITNRTPKDRRILGISKQYSRNCCFGPVEGSDRHITIPAKSTYTLELEYDVTGTGEFRAPLYFYIEDRTIRYVELVVTGEGIELSKPD